MTIGQRILEARQKAGLSQRELAGENITRNMLSAIEHDKAKPSLDTLIYLSGVLKLPVGYFLGEEAPVIEGYDRLVSARRAYAAGQFRKCLDLLERIPEGEVLEPEVRLLRVLALLDLAEKTLGDGKTPYARELVDQAEKAGAVCPYFTGELRRRLLLLRGRSVFRPSQLSSILAGLPEDGELMLRAKGAMSDRRYSDALRYLNAIDQHDPQWHYLMGEALFGQRDYDQARVHYHAVEQSMGRAVRRRLQICYAELKDFEKAYFYATME